MRRTRGARAAFATAAICTLLAVGALTAGPADLFDGIGEAQAHSGQLSPKDGCHKHKAAKERHWHVDGTATRGGECVKRDGVTFHIQEVEVEAPAPEIKTPWEACPISLAAMDADRDSLWAPTLQDRIGNVLACLHWAYPQRE